MTPAYHTTIPSPIGRLLLTLECGELTQVVMEGQKRSVRLAPHSIADRRPCEPVIEQLDEYFAGQRQRFELAIRLMGTTFQRSVWSELLKIPFGQTTTYGEIARRIGNPKAVRAVGMANGLNPIPIVVPCHRVIGASGALTGFGGGLERKSWLLKWERPTGTDLWDLPEQRFARQTAQ